MHMIYRTALLPSNIIRCIHVELDGDNICVLAQKTSAMQCEPKPEPNKKSSQKHMHEIFTSITLQHNGIDRFIYYEKRSIRRIYLSESNIVRCKVCQAYIHSALQFITQDGEDFVMFVLHSSRMENVKHKWSNICMAMSIVYVYVDNRFRIR